MYKVFINAVRIKRIQSFIPLPGNWFCGVLISFIRLEISDLKTISALVYEQIHQQQKHRHCQIYKYTSWARESKMNTISWWIRQGDVTPRQTSREFSTMLVSRSSQVGKSGQEMRSIVSFPFGATCAAWQRFSLSDDPCFGSNQALRWKTWSISHDLAWESFISFSQLLYTTVPIVCKHTLLLFKRIRLCVEAYFKPEETKNNNKLKEKMD